LFERVLGEKMSSKEIKTIYEELVTAIKLILTRKNDFDFELDFFGKFDQKQGQLLFISCSKLHIASKENQKNNFVKKSSKRGKAMKMMRKRRNKQIEGMIFKLVNIPSLLEEESTYMAQKEFEKTRTRRVKGKSFRNQINKKDNWSCRVTISKQNKTTLFGRKGCLRSKRLKPMRNLEHGLEEKLIKSQNKIGQIKKKEDLKVVEEFSRTLARPAGIRGECLSISGRIASNYTPLSRYLFIDYEKKRIMYLKLKESTKKETNLKLYPKKLNFLKQNNHQKKTKGKMYPTQKEIDRYHWLRLRDSQDNGDFKSNNLLKKNEKVDMEILKVKVDNHCNMLENYRFLISNGIPDMVVFPLSERFLEDIFKKVNIDFKNSKIFIIENQVELLVKEIKDDYMLHVKKAILDYILKDKKQRKRLNIEINSFENIREWGEEDTQCVCLADDVLQIKQISNNQVHRNSIIIKSEVKEVLNARFSILSDGKMRKSTFSMLNRKNQKSSNNFDRQSFVINQKNLTTSIPKKRGFEEIKTNEGPKLHSNLSVNFKVNNQHMNSMEQKNQIDKKVVALVNRENFKTKVDELDKKLSLFDKPMKEILTIRNYFKYSFDKRDNIIDDKNFGLEYRHVKDLIEIPCQQIYQEWDGFLERNLRRIKCFREVVIPKWMEEISNVYQTLILGNIKKEKCQKSMHYDFSIVWQESFQLT
jgi:hypothetical protein